MCIFLESCIMWGSWMVTISLKEHLSVFNSIYEFVNRRCLRFSKNMMGNALQTLVIIQLPAIVFLTMLGLLFEYRVETNIENSSISLINVAVLAPAIETLMIALAYAICHSFSVSERRAFFFNVVFFASLHCFLDPARFLPSIWAFSFFCSAYAIGFKTSFNKGFLLSFILHAMCNTLAIGIHFL